MDAPPGWPWGQGAEPPPGTADWEGLGWGVESPGPDAGPSHRPAPAHTLSRLRGALSSDRDSVSRLGSSPSRLPALPTPSELTWRPAGWTRCVPHITCAHRENKGFLVGLHGTGHALFWAL